MKVVEPEFIRNAVLIGHTQSGKTSLAESMFFVSGMIARLGKTAEGNTVMDFEPEEVKKQSSISTAIGYADWKKSRINVLDTPGDVNFFSESINCLKVVDFAILVVCAASGVEVQTEKAWDAIEKFSIPRVVFVNKMDRERADYKSSLKEVEEIFKIKPVLVQLPIGQESSFKGVIDLFTMKAYVYPDDFSGKGKEQALPNDLAGEAESLRNSMIESIVEVEDALMEKYLEGQHIADEDLYRALRTGICQGKLTPVLFGSAFKNIGIDLLLDFAAQAAPTPMDHVDLVGKRADSDQEIVRKCSPNEPFCGVVFKSIVDPFAGKLTIFRVFSGRLPSDSNMLNSTRAQKERTGQIYKLFGKKQEAAEAAVCGDIVAVAKQKVTETGDMLCDEREAIVLKIIEFPTPLLSFAVQPKTKADEDKISTAIQKILEEDKTLELRRDQETKELILSGMGQGHLEITVERMKRKFGVEVTLKSPKIPYRETVTAKVKYVQGKYKRQTGGRGQYGDAVVDIEPLSKGQGVEFVDKVVGGAIPRNFIPSVEKGIREAAQKGILAGYPVVDFEVALVDGSYHDVDSSDMAFQIAGSMAFKKAVEQARPVLLEPIMVIEVMAPEDSTGDVMGDLNGRRARILGMDRKGKHTLIKAQVPLAEVLTYEPSLRSLTAGKGSFAIEFSHYEEVPSHVAQKVIDEYKKAKGQEEQKD